MLGPLTLMPIFLGGTPQWSAAAVAATFPNLIGHLAYGVGLGVIFYLLGVRYSPWWAPRGQAEAVRVPTTRAGVNFGAGLVGVNDSNRANAAGFARRLGLIVSRARRPQRIFKGE